MVVALGKIQNCARMYGHLDQGTTLDGQAQEFAANMLLDLIKRGTVVWGSVTKVPESAREVMN